MFSRCWSPRWTASVVQEVCCLITNIISVCKIDMELHDLCLVCQHSSLFTVYNKCFLKAWVPPFRNKRLAENNFQSLGLRSF